MAKAQTGETKTSAKAKPAPKAKKAPATMKSGKSAAESKPADRPTAAKSTAKAKSAATSAASKSAPAAAKPAAPQLKPSAATAKTAGSATKDADKPAAVKPVAAKSPTTKPGDKPQVAAGTRPAATAPATALVTRAPGSSPVSAGMASSAMPSIAVKPAGMARPAAPSGRQSPFAGGLRPSTGLRSGTKAPAKVMRYKDLAFKPRFAYGEMCSLAEICGAGFGTEMGYGFARFTKARIPWAIKYDEVLMVISGVLRVRTGGRVLEAGPHDSIWLPAGTELIYEAEDALVAYAVHPIGAAPGR